MSFDLMEPRAIYIYNESLYIRSGQLENQCLCTLNVDIAWVHTFKTGSSDRSLVCMYYVFHSEASSSLPSPSICP